MLKIIALLVHRNFRRYCWDLREDYQKKPRHEKRVVAASVLERVKSTGGRFLEMSDGVFSQATEQRALEKVCQALREKKWESRKSLLGPLYSNTSVSKKEDAKAQGQKAFTKSNNKLRKVPKKASTTATSTKPSPSHQQSPPTPSETETPKLPNDEVEVGTRIEVFWPLDHKYYAATVKALIGSFAHLEYELDGVLEWLNLSEHSYRTIS